MRRIGRTELRWVIAALRVAEEAIEAAENETEAAVFVGALRARAETEWVLRCAEPYDARSRHGLVPADFEHAIRDLVAAER